MVTVKVYTIRRPSNLEPPGTCPSDQDYGRQRPVMHGLWQVQYISVFFDRGHVLWLLLPLLCLYTYQIVPLLGSAHYSEEFACTRRANPRAISSKYS